MYMFHSHDHVFTSQPPQSGETVVSAPVPRRPQQYPPLDHMFSNNMHHQQHISPQQQEQQQQQQQHQPMMPRVPPGYTDPSPPFIMPMNYSGQDFTDFGASTYIAADYNVGSHQEQAWTTPSRMPSRYADQPELSMAPANYLQPISYSFEASAYDWSAYDAATFQQQQPTIMPQMHPGYLDGYAPVTPPGQQQRHLMKPRMSSGYTMGALGQQLPTPPTASPVPRQGLKRAADDSSGTPTVKRQATGGHNAVRHSSINRIAFLAAEAKRIAAERAAEAKALAQAEAKRQEDLKRKRAEFEAEQARLRAEHAQAQQAKLEAAAQKARDDQAAEELRIAREERERKIARAKELYSDPGANFHSYLEKLEYFPLQKGQEKNPYMTSLLANRPLLGAKPGDDRYEVIMFAKEHWHDFLTLKDYDATLARIKKKKEDRVADQATHS